jgi:hypothetical protein
MSSGCGVKASGEDSGLLFWAWVATSRQGSTEQCWLRNRTQEVQVGTLASNRAGRSKSLHLQR